MVWVLTHNSHLLFNRGRTRLQEIAKEVQEKATGSGHRSTEVPGLNLAHAEHLVLTPHVLSNKQGQGETCGWNILHFGLPQLSQEKAALCPVLRSGLAQGE